MIGSAVAFAMTEAVGLAAAVWPLAWLGLFSHEPGMLATGAHYLRIVGPAYGFFGLGLALYFASQGAGRLFWPLLAGLLRVAHRGRRRCDCLAADRLARLGVRRAEPRPRRLRLDAGGGGWVRRLVPADAGNTACRRELVQARWVSRQ